MIHSALPSTDAILAHAIERNAPEIDMDDAEEIQPVRGVEKMPVGTRIEHGGKAYEVRATTTKRYICRTCAACWDPRLCERLYSCEPGGRDDGLDTILVEVTP